MHPGPCQFTLHFGRKTRCHPHRVKNTIDERKRHGSCCMSTSSNLLKFRFGCWKKFIVDHLSLYKEQVNLVLCLVQRDVLVFQDTSFVQRYMPRLPTETCFVHNFSFHGIFRGTDCFPATDKSNIFEPVYNFHIIYQGHHRIMLSVSCFVYHDIFCTIMPKYHLWLVWWNCSGADAGDGVTFARKWQLSPLTRAWCDVLDHSSWPIRSRDGHGQH